MRRGQHHTAESRAKIAAGMRGKPSNRLGTKQSAAAKASCSLSLRRYHALKRAGLWP